MSARKVASLVGKLVSVKLASPLVLVLSKGLSRSFAHLKCLEVGGLVPSSDVLTP